MKHDKLVVCPQCGGEGVIFDDFNENLLTASPKHRICIFCGGTGLIGKPSKRIKPKEDREEVR